MGPGFLASMPVAERGLGVGEEKQWGASDWRCL